MRLARHALLLPAYSLLSDFQRYCIPDPTAPDPSGVWLALAVGVSHSLVRWTRERRWARWQVALYGSAGIFMGRVVRDAREAFALMEHGLDTDLAA